MTTEDRGVEFLETRITFDFCAGHRLLNHKGKCRYPHGHNYAVSIGIIYPSYYVEKEQGYLVDFGDLKHLVKSYIDTQLDHGFILHHADPLIDKLEQLGDECVKVYIVGKPPTAETIAELICEWTMQAMMELVPEKWRAIMAGRCLINVLVSETKDNIATYCLLFNEPPDDQEDTSDE